MERIVAAREELEKQVAQKIVEGIKKLLQEKDYLVLGIVGGSSVAGVFSYLKEYSINWNKVHIFMADERLVPLDSDESNYKLAKEAFLDELLASGELAEENLHPFVYKSNQGDYGLNSYIEELNRYGGRMDMLLLSAGEDGHTASLFPNHPSIKQEDKSYILVDNSPKPPVKRISASKNLLLKAKESFLLFFGEQKVDAYRKFSDDNISIKECPSKLVKSIDKSYVFIDIEE
ncbi:6-phosphogluconolactonase [Orenia metallireducens]|jgi:6-phosphogluconolactonase|uniref:6-phosphogluconolactonase n=1 Tax=Orenia metallireducens TaxID=1413210 RepID=A0A285GDG4_9FIRM|nr:6-phosphogluconolactonase [Orenia metallireducens]PRX32458.1 6-phosphogluconolactonase [Orenia metallireducens]SNY21214.1 6-phosphogluconolactonase [Orenia metallireducens]